MCCICVCRYSIERTSDLDKYFYIDITSGALMTVRTLDREEMNWHNITVLAMEMSKSHPGSQLQDNLTQTLMQNSKPVLVFLHVEGEALFCGGTHFVLRP